MQGKPTTASTAAAVRVGINGFGRMGRLALRVATVRFGASIDIVLVNEVKGGVKAAAHLLEFDSVHGHWDAGIEAQEGKFSVDGKVIAFTEVAEPDQVPWKQHGVSVVLECTGKFLDEARLKRFLDAGVSKVIVSAPVKPGPSILNVVVGVNDHLYSPSEHHILTAASCTTNCLAPVVKVIKDNLGVKHGMITTLHDVTNTQTVVDAPHHDLRRARSCLLSLVPTTTGSATAISLIYPELQGKLNGLAVRVPLLNSSLTDAVFEVERPTTVAEVNSLFRDAAKSGPLVDILGYEERPLVSVDYRGDARSAIIDGLSTMVTNGTQVKVLAWYDNEWGYVNRMVESIQRWLWGGSCDDIIALP